MFNETMSSWERGKERQIICIWKIKKKTNYSQYSLSESHTYTRVILFQASVLGITDNTVKVRSCFLFYMRRKNAPSHYQFSDTKIQNPVSCYSSFPILYLHPTCSLRRILVFAVMLFCAVLYNGTRTSWTEDIRIGNIVLNIQMFSP